MTQIWIFVTKSVSTIWTRICQQWVDAHIFRSDKAQHSLTEAHMQNESQHAQQNDSTRKPYEAPKLVVLGDASEMTQQGTGFVTDGTVLPDNVS